MAQIEFTYMINERDSVKGKDYLAVLVFMTDDDKEALRSNGVLPGYVKGSSMLIKAYGPMTGPKLSAEVVEGGETMRNFNAIVKQKTSGSKGYVETISTGDISISPEMFLEMSENTNTRINTRADALANRIRKSMKLCEIMRLLCREVGNLAEKVEIAENASSESEIWGTW